MSDDLVEFLRARLDEDEWAARPFQHEASGVLGRWRCDESGGKVRQVEPDPLGNPDVIAVADLHMTAVHIARHDPARVLREVEAKRRIIDEHEQAGSDLYVGEPMPWCVTCSSGGWPCPTLRLLALSYADHPDYRAEEWDE